MLKLSKSLSPKLASSICTEQNKSKNHTLKNIKLLRALIEFDYNLIWLHFLKEYWRARFFLTIPADVS